jgi:hypothetical protein
VDDDDDDMMELFFRRTIYFEIVPQWLKDRQQNPNHYKDESTFV